MKKTTKLFIIFMVILCCGCASGLSVEPEMIETSSAVEPTHAVYEVRFSEFEICNDSVGSQWYIEYLHKDEHIYSGKRWTVPLNEKKKTTIDITITEQDEWDDVGKGSITLQTQDGAVDSVIIEIIENKGRYIGNKAKWEIKGEIFLVDKIVEKKPTNTMSNKKTSPNT